MLRFKFSSILCIIVAIISIGCSKSANPVDPNTVTDENMIVPLALGNKWVFSVATWDTLGNRSPMPSDSFYIVSDSSFESARWFVDQSGQLLREDSSGFTRKLATNTAEQLMFKYPTFKGEQYSTPGLDSVLVIAVDTTITVPAGSYQCIEYYYPTVSVRWFVCPGIGYIKDEQVAAKPSGQLFAWYSRELVEAIVNK